MESRARVNHNLARLNVAKQPGETPLRMGGSYFTHREFPRDQIDQSEDARPRRLRQYSALATVKASSSPEVSARRTATAPDAGLIDALLRSRSISGFSFLHHTYRGSGLFCGWVGPATRPSPEARSPPAQNASALRSGTSGFSGFALKPRRPSNADSSPARAA